MKHLMLYEEHKRSDKVLYRTTVYEWLMELIKKGTINPPKGKKFISFSYDENSGQGDSDEFGDIRVDFDVAELMRQGAREVEYTEKFFKDNPGICMYVTGYLNKQAYEKWARQNDNTWETWEEYILTFEGEEEVVLPKLKMTPKLIKKVTIWDADERDNLQEIKRTLKGHGLKVEIPWEN